MIKAININSKKLEKFLFATNLWNGVLIKYKNRN